VFWECISKHYDEHTHTAFRPSRSLEFKWCLIKHDFSKFIGIYTQVVKLNRSGSNALDILRMSGYMNCIGSSMQRVLISVLRIVGFC
jgi:hypothetical protein